MKLPKNFGGSGFSGMMKQMQDAMAQAQELEDNLKNEQIGYQSNEIQAIFDGTGQILKLKINPEVVDPEDVEALEDLIVGAVRAGFEKATELRNSRVQGIMPNLPDIPGLGG